VDISQVELDAKREISEDCLAMSEAYFEQLCEKSTEVKGGTQCIFIPSGKFFESEPYHFNNLFLASSTLLAEHSR
jgi:hypothetical protein